MKKTMRKIATAMMALMMVFSIGTAARADEGHTDGVVSIQKEIVVTNPNGADVYGPAVSYTYSIEPAAAGAVIDDGSHKAVVKAGIADAVDAASKQIIFTNEETVASSAEGTAMKATVEFTFDAQAFGAAGVYRYKITETQPENFIAAGLTRAESYVTDRFLDVYVRNIEGGLETYGFILFEGTENDNMTAASVKSNGWTADADLKNTDIYKTTNLTVSKTVTGTLADMTHQFPFMVELASNTINGAKITVSGRTEEFNGAYTLGALAKDSELKLGNNESVTITGIPVGAADTTYKVNEFNDTPDTYKASGAAEADLAANTATANEAAILTTTAVIAAFTNTLDAVSPTGLVLRFAPYALMLGAGIVLFALGRRSRQEI